jgi:hypothetical protein
MLSRMASIVPISTKNVNLIKEISLPKGYGLALVEDRRLDAYIERYLEDTKDIPIPRIRSWLKIAVSFFQLIVSLATLYRTRGTQIDQYGYAAFGLSVIPYSIMTFVNLVRTGVVGEYLWVFILRTAVLEEAEKRGGSFHGVVGKLKPLADRDASLPTFSVEEVTEGGSLGRVVVVRLGDTTKTFKLDDNKKSRDYTLQYDYIIRHKPQVLLVADRDPRGRDDDKVGSDNEIQPGEKTRINPGVKTFTSKIFRTLVLATVPLLIVVVLPYAIIYGLTRFKKGSSTHSQRAWLMSFLVADQLSFIPPFLTLHEVLPRSAFGISILISIVCTAPTTIGAALHVGKMFLQSSKCSIV